ncbi:hypothetical protein Q0Z83_110480 [Actinoplanes sichuanensis]|uniref:Wadjet protein JetD C-terminal domain-containing protein n=1 Tax=Actinoplanes sichuanensis TaxID=512349 RepID=A0ABW4A3P9_9ACTN|nr:hypothetical protein [Actinoplanes sichuanensis]BEL12857.1 hypothetical protein Q0Z83_110480 [Actinoplanes sichuanensis]
MTTADGAPPPGAEQVNGLSAALLGARAVRVDNRTLWQLWNRVDAPWAGTWASRARLAHALQQLAEQGVITLPTVTGRLWDRSLPPLPARIDVPANRRGSVTQIDPADVLWVPVMRRWAPQWMRTSRPPAGLREAAVEINRWLQSTLGAAPGWVAREERSLHIFGDEKRLAHLTDGALFAPGRLTLQDLACDAPAGHLRVARFASTGPVLVVENKATFDSAWRALRAIAESPYAAILFGSGDAVGPLVHDLAMLNELVGVRPTTCFYAGDVDIAGIEAAHLFTTKAAAVGLEASMAIPLWEAVAQAEPTGEDTTADPSRTSGAVATAESLRLPEIVLHRLRTRVRVPQERIDRLGLADVAWWAPG